MKRHPIDMDLQQKFAWRILYLRRKRKWSQEELAEATGMHKNYIGSIERLEHCPTLNIIGRIAQAFDITVSELMRFEAES
jgi:transcriptional regulator with XRE-family HTH domain